MFLQKRSIHVVRTVADYRALRSVWYQQNKTVGFVPTMGALHEGHVSLAKQARKECDIVVASIFVNPAQFAPHEDLSKYPRTEENDLALLSAKGVDVDVAFCPSVKEMYPSGIVLDVSQQTGTFVEVKGKSHQMEGLIRPHFFRGVATVVSKLFNIIQPTHAYFGQKDVQQCSVIRSLVRDLRFPIDIIVGETMRESDGLAMSSRNRYLSPQERQVAPILYKGLLAASNAFNNQKNSPTNSPVSREHLFGIVKSVLEERNQEMKLEYLSLAEPYLLEEVEFVPEKEGAILSGAIRVGSTRIIDNVLLGMNRQCL